MQSEDDGLDQATSVLRGWGGGRAPWPIEAGGGSQRSPASPPGTRLRETKSKCRAHGATRHGSFQPSWVPLGYTP